MLKVTKFVHSCLLVETPERVALFDPGTLSRAAFGDIKLDRLDDIFITHGHEDHFDIEWVQALARQYPGVRITSTPEVVKQLMAVNLMASDQPPQGVTFFDAPHEDVSPLYPQPEEIGIHYLGVLSDPGDSHSFNETKAILALPITAPWGSSINALRLALKLKPHHVLPIHDWHWSDAAREQTYTRYAKLLAEQGVTFHKLQTGQPIEIVDVEADQ